MLKRGLSILAIVLAGGCTQQPSSSPPATSPPPAVKPAGAAADAPKESTVQITFDGGYAFVHHTASRQLTVASINDNVGHDAEKMHLRADVGTYRELSNAFPPSKPAEQIWEIGKDKDGFDIDVLGVAPGITLPKSDPTMVCNPVPEHQADNLYLIPNITELARAATNGTNRGEITKDRRRFLNRVHLEGGDVVFRRASSCFEYDLNNTKTQKRFIGGRETVSVVFKIAGPLLTLQFTSVKDPSKKTNVGIEADRAGLIRLTFGSFIPPVLETTAQHSRSAGSCRTSPGFSRFS